MAYTAIDTTVRFDGDNSMRALVAGVFARSPTHWSAVALGSASGLTPEAQ